MGDGVNDKEFEVGKLELLQLALLYVWLLREEQTCGGYNRRKHQGNKDEEDPCGRVARSMDLDNNICASMKWLVIQRFEVLRVAYST